MARRRLRQSTIAYNAALAACAKEGWWEQACRMVREMDRSAVRRTRATCSAVVQACEAAGRPRAAAEVVARCFPAVEDADADADAVTRSFRELVALRLERACRLQLQRARGGPYPLAPTPKAAARPAPAPRACP
ncbi:unnamed protein product, partial [Prorocentrum cordatum]